MKPITISLPDDLAAAVSRAAGERGFSVSELPREALITHLGIDWAKRKLGFAALGSSGERNTARDFEELLAEEWPKFLAGERS